MIIRNVCDCQLIRGNNTQGLDRRQKKVHFLVQRAIREDQESVASFTFMTAASKNSVFPDGTLVHYLLHRAESFLRS
jgi:hypothetical protein